MGRDDSLDPDHGSAETIKRHDPLVVRGPETREEFCRDGKERNVLNVGVVLWVICHQMMDVVIVLPPAEAEAPDPVRDQCS